MKNGKMRIQPRLSDGYQRTPRTAGFIKEIDKAIETTSARFNVSKSFVIAVGMAEFFGIKKQPHYDE